MKDNIPCISLRVVFIIILFLVLMVFPCETFGRDESWGTQPYEKEVKRYRELVDGYNREIGKLKLHVKENNRKTGTVWAEWSPEDRSKAIEWFKKSSHLSPNLKADKDWTEKELNEARTRYSKLLGDLGRIGEERDDFMGRDARSTLWSANLDMLRKWKKALEVQKRYSSIEMTAIKAYEGIYWTGFVYDCLNKMQYILRDYINNLSGELYNCFLSAATGYYKNKMLGRPLPKYGAGFGEVSWGSKVFSCAKGIVLNSIVNALEAAVRKQFVDNMEDRGIEPQVAEFWWSRYVMPKAAKQTHAVKAFKRFLTLKFWKGQVKDELNLYLQKKLAADIKPALIKRLKNLSNQERYGDRARKLVDRVAKDRAANHTAMKFLEATEFTVSYGERALLLYYNQVGFENIAADLISKYWMIKQCLKEKKRKPHATAIIGIFKYSQKGWQDFIRDCKGGQSQNRYANVWPDISGTWYASKGPDWVYSVS